MSAGGVLHLRVFSLLIVYDCNAQKELAGYKDTKNTRHCSRVAVALGQQQHSVCSVWMVKDERVAAGHRVEAKGQWTNDLKTLIVYRCPRNKSVEFPQSR